MQKRSLAYLLTSLYTLVPLLALAVFCCAYLFASYDQLALWYHSLGPCLYRGGDWQELFFTPATKSAGNIFCLVALALIAMMLAMWRRNRRRGVICQEMADEPAHQRFSVLIYVVVALGAVALGTWSAMRHSPSTDEVFSALYAADAHPFQALTYYMLPNNHVLFNVLNSILVRAVQGDALWTGRTISVAAYTATLVVALRWLGRIMPDRAASLAAFTVLAVQGVLLGFGGQARGYALNGLAHWIAFVALNAYWRTGNQKHLQAYIWATLIGYATLPTFLNFHVGAACWATLRDVRKRNINWLFWRSQMLGAVAAFLFYVPLFCFSGADALTNNPWSAPGKEPFTQWVNRAVYNLADYDNYAFAGPTGWLADYSTVLLLLPVALLLVRASPAARRAGGFVVAMWCGFLFVIVVMRKDPFHRNLIGLFSISAAVSMVALHLVISRALQRLRATRWTTAAFVTVCALLVVNYLRWFLREMPGRLYYYDVDANYHYIEEAVKDVPLDENVYASDEVFVAHYILRKRGAAITHCFDTSAPSAWYMRHLQEPLLPPAVMQQYQLTVERADMQFYVRVADSTRAE